MITVEDAMEKNVIVFKAEDKISDVAEILRKNKISGAPIVNNDQNITGIVSEGDLMRLIEVHSPQINLILPAPLDLIELPLKMQHEFDEISKGLKKASSVMVGEIMTKKVISVHKEVSISDAAQIMDTKKINRLPVIDENNKLIGIVTRGDIIGAMGKKG